MKFSIVIPAHNEDAFLAQTLDSIVAQTLNPQHVIVVNDHSTDGTEAIIDRFAGNYPFITKRNISSSDQHMPGSKVVNAFNKGLEKLDGDFDVLLKLDADIVLPPDYFQKIASIFLNDPKVGIAGGFAYEQNAQGVWALNHPMNKDHVRGAFKAYRKSCFDAIGGLRTAMGWDTVDELLARYNGFTILTDGTLQVRHLRPTGKAYNKKARLLQGKAMYTMRYGFWITLIASLKMAQKQHNIKVLSHNLLGFWKARKERAHFLVTPEEGRFIRRFRWQGIANKLK